MKKDNGNKTRNEVGLECKMIKKEIIRMISIIGLDHVGILYEMKSAIINAQADYYYSMLVSGGLDASPKDPFEEYLDGHLEEYFEYLTNCSF